MENKNNDDFGVCSGRDSNCEWVHNPGPLACESSNVSTCNVVNILEAEESDFHDSNLIAATAAIKQILANIPPDENGRNLSFLHTNMGQLLAWVNHGAEPVEGGVRANDDDDTVAAALKLKL